MATLRLGLGVHCTEQAHDVLALEDKVQAMLTQAGGSVALGAEIPGVSISAAQASVSAGAILSALFPL